MIRAIVFDCFGVLYANAKHLYGSRFPEFAQELRNLSLASDHGFISRKEYLEGVSKLTGDSPEYIDRVHVHEHTINEQLIEYIRRELKPQYKIGLLSNIGQDFIQKLFDEHDLHDLFDTVVLSSNVGYIKPDPEIYQIMLEQLDVPADTAIMIDDREPNCQGAEAVGMKSIFYQSYDQMVKELNTFLKEDTDARIT